MIIMMYSSYIALCVLFSAPLVVAYVEDGHKSYKVNLEKSLDETPIVKSINFTKSMFKGSVISFKIDCKQDKEDSTQNSDFRLDMLLISHTCNHVIRIPNSGKEQIFNRKLKCNNHIVLDKKDLENLIAIKDDQLYLPQTKPTEKTSMTVKDTETETEGSTEPEETPIPTKKQISKDHSDSERDNQGNDDTKARKKRDTADDKKISQSGKKKKKKSKAKKESKNSGVKKTNKKGLKKTGEIAGVNTLPAVKNKAVYVLKLTFHGSNVNFTVYIESKHKESYLSALNWPFLPFYGGMSLLYLAFAIGWSIASCCNWRDLLRVQFWIGGVIAIGMLENALFYTEYQNISHTGKENGLLYFAEIVSCIKRALARILVVIVSMGFGIVKPRLGETLHKVLAIGGLYFLVATIEGCLRVHDDNKIVAFNSKTHMYALIPLIVIDVGLSWWVFTSLVQTTRTLRIRKNIVKLTLYRHFTNTLVFAVIASLAYMVWMIKEARFTECVDITGLWLNDAIWPFLFSLILAVIMILWRPSVNNQRYAFTPLDLGDSDEENDDLTLSEAFEGMKMRNKSDSQLNGTVAKNRNKADDDLRWVEENIPSVPSTLLPTLDSDEEIIMTKFETSKMD